MKNRKLLIITAGTMLLFATWFSLQAMILSHSVQLENNGFQVKEAVSEDGEYQTIRIEVEDADILADTYHFGDQSAIGVTDITDPEDEGGKGISASWHTNYLVYKNVNFGLSTTQIKIRKEVPRGCIMEFWMDRHIGEDKSLSEGTRIGSIEVSGVETGWGKWYDFDVDITGASGVHDLYIVFLAGGGSNAEQNYGGFNWFEITRLVETDVEIESIAVNPEAISTYPGWKNKVELTILPEVASEKAVVWSVVEESTEGMVVIENNEIASFYSGTATLKVASATNEEIFAIVELQVNEFNRAETIRIEVEDADIMEDTYHFGDQSAIGVTDITDPEDEGGKGISASWNTNYLVYRDIDFGLSATQIKIRKEVPRGCIMEFWVDRNMGEDKSLSGGTRIGSIEVSGVETGWGKWYDFDVNVSGASGVHDLYIVFLAGGGSNAEQNYGGFNWFEITRHFMEIESIEVEESEIKLYEEMTYSPVVTVLPELAADNEIVWRIASESESGVISIEDGVIKALKAGTAQVKIASVQNEDVYATMDITVPDFVLLKENIRIEAVEAVGLYDTFHWDSPIGIVEEGENPELPYVGNIWHGNFAIYENVDFGSYTTDIKVRKEVPRGCRIEFWIDRTLVDEEEYTLEGGALIGSLLVDDSKVEKGWGNWYEFSVPVSEVTGVHDVYIIFYAGGGSTDLQNFGGFKWFELSRKEILPERIVLSESKLEMEIGETETIEITVEPAEAYNKQVEYFIEDSLPEIVSVSLNGNVLTVKAENEGTITLPITSVAHPEISVGLDIKVENLLGIEGNGKVEARIYPTIAETEFTIESEEVISEVIVYNTAGMIVASEKVNGNYITIPCEAYNNGMYLVKVNTQSGSKVYRIVKK